MSDPGSYWHLKNPFKHLNFFHIKHNSSDIWLFLSKKMEKFTWKCVKPLFLKYFFLVYITLHCQSTDRIRIRWKFSRSDQKGPDSDPQPCIQVGACFYRLPSPYCMPREYFSSSDLEKWSPALNSPWKRKCFFFFSWTLNLTSTGTVPTYYVKF